MTLALPYRDDSRTPLAFSLAVLLHVLLALAVAGLFLFKPAPEPTQNKVFELVAAPPSDADEQAAPGPPNLSLPKLTVPSIPTPPQPAEPTPVPTPAPAVTNPPAKPAPPKPVLTHLSAPGPKAPATQTETPYEKFLRDHHVTNTPASPPHTTGRPTPTVSVNVNSIVKNLETAANGANGQARGRANATTSAEVQDYVDKLIARLQEAFVPPGGVSGLSAEVFLEIGPNGELVKKYLSHSSGNAEFDEAVKAALQSLTNVDPPPGGVQVHYTFTFTPSAQ